MLLQLSVSWPGLRYRGYFNPIISSNNNIKVAMVSELAFCLGAWGSGGGVALSKVSSFLLLNFANLKILSGAMVGPR